MEPETDLGSPPIETHHFSPLDIPSHGFIVKMCFYAFNVIKMETLAQLFTAFPHTHLEHLSTVHYM